MLDSFSIPTNNDGYRFYSEEIQRNGLLIIAEKKDGQ